MNVFQIIGAALMVGAVLFALAVAVVTFPPYTAAMVLAVGGFLLYLFGEQIAINKRHQKERSE